MDCPLLRTWLHLNLLKYCISKCNIYIPVISQKHFFAKRILFSCFSSICFFMFCQVLQNTTINAKSFSFHKRFNTCTHTIILLCQFFVLYFVTHCYLKSVRSVAILIFFKTFLRKNERLDRIQN